MNDTERFESFMKLAEYSNNHFLERRRYEWKILIGFWAAILVIAHKDWTSPQIPWWVWVIAWIVFAFTWVRGIFVANTNDKLRSEYFRLLAEDTAAGNGRNPRNSPPKLDQFTKKWLFGFLLEWGGQFQVLATAAVMYVAYLIQQAQFKL